MQLSGVYSGMSDAELDAAYENTFNAFKAASGANRNTLQTALVGLATEIIDRLAGVVGFASGFFGYTRFPKYDAIQKTNPDLYGFQQVTQARTAVKESAADVASQIKFGVGGAVALGVGVVLLYAYLRGKK